MHDVFISYSGTDKATADAICAALEQRGIRCWIAPRDITFGMDYAGAIIDAIGKSKILVLVFSSRSNGSRSVRNELERAFSKDIPIHPVRIENIMATGPLEYFLGLPQWFDAYEPPLEKHLADLGDAVAAALFSKSDANLAGTDADKPEQKAPSRAARPKAIPVTPNAPQPEIANDPEKPAVSSFWAGRRLAPIVIAGAVAVLLAGVLVVAGLRQSGNTGDGAGAPGDAHAPSPNPELHLDNAAAAPPVPPAPVPPAFNALVRAAVEQANDAETQANRAAAAALQLHADIVQATQLAEASAQGYGTTTGPVSGRTDGATYQWSGQIVNTNVAQGLGLFVFSFGTRLEGEAKNNQINGLGALQLSIGEHYEGQFAANVREGFGVDTFAPGGGPREEAGEWEKDHFIGYGTEHWPDGTVWIGHWSNGNLDGYGAKLAGGRTIIEQGFYKDGDLKVALKP